MTTAEERESFERFRDYYAGAGAPVIRELERRVLSGPSFRMTALRAASASNSPSRKSVGCGHDSMPSRVI